MRSQLLFKITIWFIVNETDNQFTTWFVFKWIPSLTYFFLPKYLLPSFWTDVFFLAQGPTTRTCVEHASLLSNGECRCDRGYQDVNGECLMGTVNQYYQHCLISHVKFFTKIERELHDFHYRTKQGRITPPVFWSMI